MSNGFISGTVFEVSGHVIPAASGTVVYACSIDDVDENTDDLVDSDYAEGYPDVSGVYTLSLLASPQYDVWAEADGYSMQFQLGVSIADGQTTPVNFLLPLAASISGTVVNSAGAPLPSVDVYAVETSDTDTGWAIGVTDASGTFAFGDVDAVSQDNPSGAIYQLYALSPDDKLSMQNTSVSPGAASRVDFQL